MTSANNSSGDGKFLLYIDGQAMAVDWLYKKGYYALGLKRACDQAYEQGED